MEQQTEELKELVRQSIAVSKENNKMLHAMRRSARWHLILNILWWVVVFGVSGAAYYYYIWPYLQQILHLYQQLLQGGQQAQTAMQQFQHLLDNVPGFASSTSTPH